MLTSLPGQPCSQPTRSCSAASLRCSSATVVMKHTHSPALVRFLGAVWELDMLPRHGIALMALALAGWRDCSEGRFEWLS